MKYPLKLLIFYLTMLLAAESVAQTPSASGDSSQSEVKDKAYLNRLFRQAPVAETLKIHLLELINDDAKELDEADAARAIEESMADASKNALAEGYVYVYLFENRSRPERILSLFGKLPGKLWRQRYGWLLFVINENFLSESYIGVVSKLAEDSALPPHVQPQQAELAYSRTLVGFSAAINGTNSVSTLLSVVQHSIPNPSQQWAMVDQVRLRFECKGTAVVQWYFVERCKESGEAEILMKHLRQCLGPEEAERLALQRKTRLQPQQASESSR